MIGITLGDLDSAGDDWAHIEDYYDRIVTEYGERRRAFSRKIGPREWPVEETASVRRLAAAKKAAGVRNG